MGKGGAQDCPCDVTVTGEKSEVTERKMKQTETWESLGPSLCHPAPEFISPPLERGELFFSLVNWLTVQLKKTAQNSGHLPAPTHAHPGGSPRQ